MSCGDDPADAEVLGGEWPPAGAEPVAVDDLYDRLAAAGVDYGPELQGIRAGSCIERYRKHPFLCAL